jgi:hypothetical protein
LAELGVTGKGPRAKLAWLNSPAEGLTKLLKRPLRKSAPLTAVKPFVTREFLYIFVTFTLTTLMERLMYPGAP